MKTQWKKGFRRLLIVLSLLWLVFSTAVAVAAQAAPLDDEWAALEKKYTLKPATPETKQDIQTGGLRARIQAAKEAGFNDDEILARIQGNADMAARIQKARDAGFTDDEIFGRMGLKVARKDEKWWENAPIVSLPQTPSRNARSWVDKLQENAGLIFGPIIAMWVLYFALAWVVAGFSPKE